MGHNVRIEIRDINNIFQLKQLLVYKGINLNIDFAITFYIRIAIANKNKIGPIKLLKRNLI